MDDDELFDPEGFAGSNIPEMYWNYMAESLAHDLALEEERDAERREGVYTYWV